MNKKLKLYCLFLLEKYAPITLSLLIVLIFHYLKILNIDSNLKDRIFNFSMAMFAILITHKSIILTIDKNNHKGFAKLSQERDFVIRLFTYLNNCIYNSFFIIFYIFICSFINVLLKNEIILFCTSLLIFQTFRFLLIFSTIFEKTISNISN